MGAQINKTGKISTNISLQSAIADNFKTDFMYIGYHILLIFLLN